MAIKSQLLLYSTVRVRKFRLILRKPVGVLAVILLVYLLVKNKVEELDLSLPLETLFWMPPSLFTSESLTSLKLRTECRLIVPDSICFPRLKALHLSLVKFQDEQSTQRLFCGCLVLEELFLFCCDWTDISNITISFPTPREFDFFHDSWYPENFLDCKIEISAPKLSYVNCQSDLSLELVFLNLSALTDATVSLMNYRIAPLAHRPHRTLKLLAGFHGVIYLAVSNETLEALSFAENLLAHLPTFFNLTYLVVNDGCSGRAKGALVCILQKSPNLHWLDFPQGLQPAGNDETEIWTTVLPSFKCFLKTFSISDFNGSEREIHILKNLLENATVLERMSVSFSEDQSANLDMQEDISNQLRQLSGVSKSCVIEFC